MANEFRIVNGLALDFLPATGGGSDAFLMRDSTTGLVTQTSSVPASRVSSGGNLTEATSSVLTITGGTGVLLGNASIQVKQATTSQSGYLSSADWNTFNSKLTGSLADSRLFVGSSGGLAIARDITGDVTFNNTGVTAIAAGAIVNNDINAIAAIAVSKLAAMSVSLAVVTDSSGFLTTVAGVSSIKVGYLSNVTGDIQSQFTITNQRIVGIQTTATVLSPGSGQDGYAITWNNGSLRWDLTSISVQGIPVGGSTSQVLMKNSGTPYDASWTSFLVSHISDLTGVVTADINILAGASAAGVTDIEFQYINGTNSNIQNQINNKQDRSLSPNSIWVGNGSSVPTPLSAGTEGYVLTISGGTPSWVVASASSGFYQTFQSAGSPQTQRVTANFKNGLNAADNTTVTDVKLGGALTENTAITGAFTFGITGLTSFTASASDGNTFLVNTSGLQVTLVGTDTFKEAADYSTNYVARSYISKGYADATYVSSVNSGNGITVDNTDPVNPIVNLGGTITDDITLSTTGTESLGFSFGGLAVTNLLSVAYNRDSYAIQLFNPSLVQNGLTFDLTQITIQSSLGSPIALISDDGAGVGSTGLIGALLVQLQSESEINISQTNTGHSLLMTSSGVDLTISGDAGGIGHLIQGGTAGHLQYLDPVATGNVLLSGGVAAINSWGKVGLTTHVSGVLPIANGGTGSSTVNFWPLTGSALLTGDVVINAGGTRSIAFGQSGNELVNFNVTTSNDFHLFTGDAASFIGQYSIVAGSTKEMETTVALSGVYDIGIRMGGDAGNGGHLNITSGAGSSITTTFTISGWDAFRINLGSDAVGDLHYTGTSLNQTRLVSVAAGSYMRSGGVATAPVWSTVTLPNSSTIGDIIFASSANTYTNLADIAIGNVLLSGGVGAIPAYGKVTSSHIDATVQATGLSWLLASGGTLTGNNTLVQAGFSTTFTGIGKVTFSPTSGASSIAGVNTGVITGDPTTIVDGDIWYDNTVSFPGFRVGKAGTVHAIATVTTATATRIPYWTSGSQTTLTDSVGLTFDATTGLSLTTATLAATGYLNITSTSTTINHTLGTSGIIDLLSTGANSTASKTVVGISSVIQNTGTTNTNVAYYGEATGASATSTPNIAFQGVGNVQTKGYETTATYNLSLSKYNENTTQSIALIGSNMWITSAAGIVRENTSVSRGQALVMYTGYSGITGNNLGWSVFNTGSSTLTHPFMVNQLGVVQLIAGGQYGWVTSTTDSRGVIASLISHSSGTISVSGTVGTAFTQSTQSTTHTFVTFTQSVHTGGVPTGLLWTGGAHTTITASEFHDFNINLSRTVQFTGSTGFATQRAYRIQAPTYAFQNATGTITDGYTFYVDAPPTAGTNAIITNKWAAGFGGAVKITGVANSTILLVEEDGGVNILEIIEAAGVNKIGFFAAAPVAQQAGLTAITHTAPGTPDYALQDLVAATGFGFATKDEGNTLLSVVKAMHDAMKNYGLLT